MDILPGNISQKIVYQDMNKRRTIYNLGFRLMAQKVIDLLHTCQDIYEGDLGMYSCTIPYSPLEYINSDKPPAEDNGTPKEQRLNNRTSRVNPTPGTPAPGEALDAAAGGTPAPPAAAPAAAGDAGAAPPVTAAPAVTNAAPVPPAAAVTEPPAGDKQLDARTKLRQMIRSQRGL